MINILFVHQSSDLYGSDKVLLDLVVALDKSRFYPIVLLPDKGPLLEVLKENDIEAYSVQLTRLRRSTLKTLNFIKLPYTLINSIKAVDRIVASKNINIVQSNTLAVLSGAVWARLRGLPHIWHVHEIITSPVFAIRAYGWLLRLFASKIVCNSKATCNFLAQIHHSLSAKSIVIYNGLVREDATINITAENYRKQLDINNNDILVALVGRINRFKGQDRLVVVANQLWAQGIRNVHYLLVGSPPQGQENCRDSLVKRIQESPAVNQITLQDFQSDIWDVWDACDIAVVPSTEPESFGLVALEAMTAGKPVIASDHGGIVEVVVHGETGLLIKPGNNDKLAEAILTLVSDKDMRVRFGEKGRLRWQKHFSMKNFVSAFEEVYQNI